MMQTNDGAANLLGLSRSRHQNKRAIAGKLGDSSWNCPWSERMIFPFLQPAPAAGVCPLSTQSGHSRSEIRIHNLTECRRPYVCFGATSFRLAADRTEHGAGFARHPMWFKAKPSTH
jgi:hypothetical protein